MNHHGIIPIDMVVVNLYPFKKTVEKPGCTFEEAVENIDIGGPAMLRSSAKNFESVTVIVQGVGKTTKMLNQLEAGSSICDIVGPLGKPSEVHLYGTAVVIEPRQ